MRLIHDRQSVILQMNQVLMIGDTLTRFSAPLRLKPQHSVDAVDS